MTSTTTDSIDERNQQEANNGTNNAEVRRMNNQEDQPLATAADLGAANAAAANSNFVRATRSRTRSNRERAAGAAASDNESTNGSDEE